MSSSAAKSADEIRAELLSGAHVLAGRVQRLARLRGAAWWVFCVVAALLALVAVDVLLRREEVGLRLLSLAVWIGAIVWATWRFLQPVWKLSPTPLQLARWIERSRPDLGDRLSTAVQLAESNSSDERFGSLAFREAVLRRWQAESHKPDWASYLDGTQVRRIFVLLAALLLGGFAIAALWPAESRLALQRFFVPWSAPAWPRRDQLEFVNLPSIAASGSELQLEIVDRNEPLPNNVAVRMRLAGETLSRESEIAAKIIDNLAIANLPPLEQAIEVRAVGGDDTRMPWQRIDVVSPPKLEQYQFSIEPPAYSGRPAAELIGTRVQVLAGSKVLFTGQLDQPVRSAVIKRLNDLNATGDDQPQAEESLSVVLPSSPATRVTVGTAEGEPIELTTTVAWRLEVETKDGLQIELPQRWTVDVVDDAPPTAVLLPPSLQALTDSGQMLVAGTASDDLGLETVSVVAAVDGSSNERVSLLLWSGSEEVRQDVSVEGAWDISAAFQQAGQSLATGQVLTVWLEAKDQLGQIGRSQVERLEIQSAEKVIAALVERQNRLLEQLREMIMVQRRNQGMTDRAEKQLGLSESIAQGDIDALNGVAQSQASLANQLSGQQDSLLEQVQELQDLLELNRLGQAGLAGQLGELQRELEGVAVEDMPQAVAAASSAHEAAAELLEDQSSAVSETLDRLAESSQAQSSVLEKIQRLADGLNRSGGIQQLQQELSALARKQELLRNETEGLQLEQLRGARPDALESARRAMVGEQEALAQQLDNVLERARELTGNAGTDADAGVEALRQAVAGLSDEQTGQLMQQAAEEIAARELTSALESQGEAAEALARAMQQLSPSSSGSRAGDLSQQAEQLRARRDAVTELAQAQESLAEAMRGASGDAGQQLSEQQEALADATERQAQLARQQGDPGASEPLESIAESQAEASQAAAEEDMRAAASAAEQAAEELSQLAEQLQDRAQELSRQSQRQQMYQLQDALQGLVDTQQPLVQSVVRLADEFQTASRTAELQQQAREFAADQESVRQRLSEVLKTVADMPAFGWTLEQTAEDMAKAVAAAERFRVAPDAQTAANDALRKLELTLSAVESATSTSKQPQGGEEQAGTGDSQQQGDQSSEAAFPPLASLKLLRGLQQELNSQTQQLDSESDVSRKNRRLREIGDQQQALGTQLETLLREMGSR